MKLLWIAVWLAASTAHAQTRWTLATGYGEKSFHTTNIVQFASDVERLTGGALKVAVHPNNALVKLADIPQAVRDGRIQAGESIMTGMAKDIPMAGADAIPFVVGSYADAKRMWVLQRPLIERSFAQRGLKALYAVPWPPQGLYTQKPVTSASDFKGTRMRTYNATTVRIAGLLGASPVDVPMVEVNQALGSGRIDNMITSAVTGVENEAWRHIGFFHEINAWFPKNIVFVNRAAFEALSPQLQQSVLQASADAEARGWAASEAASQSSLRELQARGMKVERVPPAFEAALKRMGETFSREWVREVGNEANQLFVPYYLQR